jgi:hypothetical protein
MTQSTFYAITQPQILVQLHFQVYQVKLFEVYFGKGHPTWEFARGIQVVVFWVELHQWGGRN